MEAGISAHNLLTRTFSAEEMQRLKGSEMQINKVKYREQEAVTKIGVAFLFVHSVWY